MEWEDVIHKEDVKLSNFIVGYYWVQALNLLVKLVLGGFPMWIYISKGIMLLLLIFALKPMLKRQLKLFLFIEFAFLAMFSYTFLRGFADINEYSSLVINVFTVFIPMAVALVAVYDKNVLLNQLYIASWPTQVVLIIVLMSRSDYSYSMVGGYTLMFQALIVFDHLCEKRRILDIVACLFDFILVFIYGSRGAILCAVVMIILKILFDYKTTVNKKVLIIVLITILTMILFSFYEKIVAMLIAITNSLGYSSRNLYLLLQGEIASDSGRNVLIQEYLNMVKTGPAFGYGLAGGWASPGMYPHNIFVELLLAFGPVLGIIACLCVLVLSIKSIIGMESCKRRLGHIFFAYSICLLLSDSFLQCPMFFMLMAIGFQSLSHKYVIGKKSI